jgi:predicted dehydrogenase
VTSADSAMRASVVGLGRMGMRHVEVLQGLGMTIVGIADQNAEAVAAARDIIGTDTLQGFADGIEMLGATRPEAVVIATTAPAHFPLVKAAVEAGARYILCEKPIAISLAEAEEMVALCNDAGVMLSINHQMRFMDNFTEAKRLAESEELGGLVSMVVAGSNFGLAMNGSHYFEAFRWITGAPVTHVSGWLEPEILPNPRGPQFEDRSGRVLARNAAGQTLYMDVSSKAGWGVCVTYICRYGQIFIDELLGEMRVVAREAEYRDLPTARYGMPVERRQETITPADSLTPTRAVWQAMLAGHDYPTGEDGLAAIRCLVAMHISDEAGGTAIPVEAASTARERRFAWA